MTYPTITFTPSSENKHYGKLFLPGGCSLEDLYNAPQCPLIIKETLEKHVSWQVRVETPIHLALGLKNHFLQFRAAMALFGVADITEGESVELLIEEARFGSSMVRPTPAHTPIVGSFARIILDQDVIKTCNLSITGIEKRRVTIPDTTELTGKDLLDLDFKSVAKSISSRYPGFSDFNGTAEYRQAMLAVTLERALIHCSEEVNHE